MTPAQDNLHLNPTDLLGPLTLLVRETDGTVSSDQLEPRVVDALVIEGAAELMQALFGLVSLTAADPEPPASDLVAIEWGDGEVTDGDDSGELAGVARATAGLVAEGIARVLRAAVADSRQ